MTQSIKIKTLEEKRTELICLMGIMIPSFRGVYVEIVPNGTMTFLDELYGPKKIHELSVVKFAGSWIRSIEEHRIVTILPPERSRSLDVAEKLRLMIVWLLSDTCSKHIQENLLRNQRPLFET